MSTSKIEWTEKVWNPTTGCTKVSPGCAHCYAETLTKRYAGANGWPATFKPWTPENADENVVLHPDRLDAPLHWKKPSMVFVDSMSDLFHENVPDEFIDQVFAVMALTPQHTYQVLTKRPERMREYITAQASLAGRFDAAGREFANPDGTYGRIVIEACLSPQCPNDFLPMPWPLPNVWLGVTVENQRWADERIPILLDTPAAVRFVSAEPLLEAVKLTHIDLHDTHPRMYQINALTGLNTDMGRPCPDVPHINWVIIGGESGPKHRHFDPDWARSLVAQCRTAGVAPFVKQMGGARPGNRLEDLPEDLRVREFPLQASVG